MGRKLLSVIAGWLSGLIVLGIGMALTAYFGPVGLSARRAAQIYASHGREAAMAWMVGREAHELTLRGLALLIYTTVPLTCLAAGMVATLLCRRVSGRALASIALLGAVGPLAFEWFVFPRPYPFVISFAVAAVVGVSAAVCCGVLVGRRVDAR